MTKSPLPTLSHSHLFLQHTHNQCIQLFHSLFLQTLSAHTRQHLCKYDTAGKKKKRPKRNARKMTEVYVLQLSRSRTVFIKYSSVLSSEVAKRAKFLFVDLMTCQVSLALTSKISAGTTPGEWCRH